MSKIPVIIDCDPGHDDFIALALALASDKLDVKGIVTVAGNQTLEKVTVNALKAVELMGRTDVPVVAGSAKPMRKAHVPVPQVHGESGLDGPSLPDPTTQVLDKNFVDFYADILRESSEKVTILAVGPLTNIATLFYCHPELVEKVAAINVMGGANRAVDFKDYPCKGAEFNIWQDAESAHFVFDLDVPVTMFGLDMTYQTCVTPAEFERFAAEGGKVGKVVSQLLTFFYRCQEKNGMKACPIHDACPVAYTIAPEMFQVEHRDITVEYEGEHTYGFTYVDMRVYKEPGKKNYWCVSTDRDAFVEMLIKACKSYD